MYRYYLEQGADVMRCSWKTIRRIVIAVVNLGCVGAAVAVATSGADEATIAYRLIVIGGVLFATGFIAREMGV